MFKGFGRIELSWVAARTGLSKDFMGYIIGCRGVG